MTYVREDFTLMFDYVAPSALIVNEAELLISNEQTRYASQWLNPGDEDSLCNIAMRVVASEFFSLPFVTIDPTISTL